MEIYLDGGVRRGTDVLKALALGARAVGMGRPFLHALTVGGEAAIQQMLAILHTELQSNMALSMITDELLIQLYTAKAATFYSFCHSG